MKYYAYVQSIPARRADPYTAPEIYTGTWEYRDDLENLAEDADEITMAEFNKLVTEVDRAVLTLGDALREFLLSNYRDGKLESPKICEVDRPVFTDAVHKFFAASYPEVLKIGPEILARYSKDIFMVTSYPGQPLSPEDLALVKLAKQNNGKH